MKKRTLGRSGRIGWLITTLLLAIALVFSSWSNYRYARDAASTVTRGQSELLEAALRPILPTTDSASDLADKLRTFVEEHSAAGVRYVALLDPDGRVEASAGDPVIPPALPPADSMRTPGGPGQLTIDVGERRRTYFVRPFPRAPGPPPMRGPDDVRRDGPPRNGADPAQRIIIRGRDPRDGNPGGDRRGRFFHYALIEFEPVIAQGLVARAEQAFLLNLIGAGILTLAALLFWRISQKYESAREHLEEQKRLSVLGEMSAVLAHEIRNPLASLKGNAQLLAERLPEASKEQARAVRVVTEATRLEALTTDLLDFARTGPIERQAANPVAVLQTAVEDLAEDSFEIDTAGAPTEWRLDSNRIRHALVNMLQNARQATVAGSTPRVTVRKERDRLVYEIRDFGPGLPQGSEDRIFDPFFTTRTNGTGLGLAVARRVAELHGGQVTAHNHAEGGAVFRIELP
jgi:two-component system, NtrC family, sensor histidine kinase HydH